MLLKITLVLNILQLVVIIALTAYCRFKLSKPHYKKDDMILRGILETVTVSDARQDSALKIRTVLSRYYGIDYCSLFVYHQESAEMYILSTNIHENYHNELECYINELYATMKKLSNAYINTIHDGYHVYPTAAARNIKYIYFIPLTTYGKVIGGLLIENTSIKHMQRCEEEFFQVVLNNIAIVMQNIAYNAKLSDMANIDGLTKAYNKSYFLKNLKDQVFTSHKNKQPLTLAMFDIDYFKKCNDVYGHQFGDKVLVSLIELVKNSVRKDEKVFRYGGEEFAIIFQGAHKESIFRRIESIREKISVLPLNTEKGDIVYVTASFGLADITDDAETPEMLIEKADKALYAAKNAGRNKVMLA